MSGSRAIARRVLEAARQRGAMVATAESCTGGMIAAALTDIAGSSDVVDRGFVTYSNRAKQEMLGVGAATLARHGAVSRETAMEMAEGALARSQAAVAVAVTGIAGPGGGSPDKPVGLVWFGLAAHGRPTVALSHRFADEGRGFIRSEAVKVALGLLCEALEDQVPGAP